LYSIDSNLPVNDNRFLKQDGKTVFRHAVQSMSDACNTVLQRNNLQIEDINWLIPHQANQRIIDAVGRSLNIPEDRALSNIEYLGNTIADPTMYLAKY
jgi:3-oxoacyl-[acyl-carrier-protein] synthase-3